jgi:preprotein translocase subunit SecG
MLTVIIVIHLMLVLALIGVVLLQKSEGGGLVSGSSGGFMTSRGTANVLSRTTAMLAAAFFVTSLMLSWLASFQRHPASIIGGPPAGRSAPGPTTLPLNQGSGGVLNQLQKGIPGAPEGPRPAPGGPQVPESR